MTVYIVDDSPVFRERITLLLTELEGIEIAGLAEDAQDAIASIGALAPDVVLLDMRLKTGTGVDVLKGIRTMEPRPKVIVLTSYNDPVYKQISIRFGAHAFITKGSASTELVRALEGLRMQMSPAEGKM
jgi:DNA-binding NarL/FixJ family response regulator